MPAFPIVLKPSPGVGLLGPCQRAWRCCYELFAQSCMYRLQPIRQLDCQAFLSGRNENHLKKNGPIRTWQRSRPPPEPGERIQPQWLSRSLVPWVSGHTGRPHSNIRMVVLDVCFTWRARLYIFLSCYSTTHAILYLIPFPAGNSSSNSVATSMEALCSSAPLYIKCFLNQRIESTPERASPL